MKLIVKGLSFKRSGNYIVYFSLSALEFYRIVVKNTNVHFKLISMNLTRTPLHFLRSKLLLVLEICLISHFYQTGETCQLGLSYYALNQIMTVNQAEQKVFGRKKTLPRNCCQGASKRQIFQMCIFLVFFLLWV